MMLLSNGVVGGLALFSLILMTTVIVFGIKFILDRNLEQAAPQSETRPESAAQTEDPEDKQKRPLYVVKQTNTGARRKRRPSASGNLKVVPPETVYRLEPVTEKEKTVS